MVPMTTPHRSLRPVKDFLRQAAYAELVAADFARIELQVLYAIQEKARYRYWVWSPFQYGMRCRIAAANGIPMSWVQRLYIRYASWRSPLQAITKMRRCHDEITFW